MKNLLIFLCLILCFTSCSGGSQDSSQNSNNTNESDYNFSELLAGIYEYSKYEHSSGVTSVGGGIYVGGSDSSSTYELLILGTNKTFIQCISTDSSGSTTISSSDYSDSFSDGSSGFDRCVYGTYQMNEYYELVDPKDNLFGRVNLAFQPKRFSGSGIPNDACALKDNKTNSLEYLNGDLDMKLFTDEANPYFKLDRFILEESSPLYSISNFAQSFMKLNVKYDPLTGVIEEIGSCNTGPATPPTLNDAILISFNPNADLPNTPNNLTNPSYESPAMKLYEVPLKAGQKVEFLGQCTDSFGDIKHFGFFYPPNISDALNEPLTSSFGTIHDSLGNYKNFSQAIASAQPISKAYELQNARMDQIITELPTDLVDEIYSDSNPKHAFDIQLKGDEIEVLYFEDFESCMHGLPQTFYPPIDGNYILAIEVNPENPYIFYLKY